MSVGKLATALTAIFVVSVVVLVGELLYVLWRRRSFRLQSSHSQHPIYGDHQQPDHLLTSDSSAKELLYFFCLKAQTRVEPSESPTQKPGGSSSEDPMIDVFKLLEANGPSRVLSTIKEDDREDIESTSMSGVDSVEIAATERVSLQECLESEAAEKVVAVTVDVEVEDTKTVFLSPCDSPMFFTPVGSPSRDGTDSKFVFPATETAVATGQ